MNRLKIMRAAVLSDSTSATLAAIFLLLAATPFAVRAGHVVRVQNEAHLLADFTKSLGLFSSQIGLELLVQGQKVLRIAIHYPFTLVRIGGWQW